MTPHWDKRSVKLKDRIYIYSKMFYVAFISKIFLICNFNYSSIGDIQRGTG